MNNQLMLSNWIDYKMKIAVIWNDWIRNEGKCMRYLRTSSPWSKIHLNWKEQFSDGMDLWNIQRGINLMQEDRTCTQTFYVSTKRYICSNSANAIISLASGVLLNGVLAALNSLKPEGGGSGRLFIVKNLSSNITAVPMC